LRNGVPLRVNILVYCRRTQMDDWVQPQVNPILVVVDYSADEFFLGGIIGKSRDNSKLAAVWSSALYPVRNPTHAQPLNGSKGAMAPFLPAASMFSSLLVSINSHG
jgi:hypothetical protein